MGRSVSAARVRLLLTRTGGGGGGGGGGGPHYKTVVSEWSRNVSTGTSCPQRLTSALLSANASPRQVEDGPNLVLPASSHRGWAPDAAVKLRLQDTGPQSMTPISIPTLLRDTVEKIPNNLAMGIKGPQGDLLTWTYSRYLEEVEMAAKGFLSLGLQPFHSVCILGCNAPEWFISSLAAVHCQGFACGIYQTNSGEACRYVAQHSRANIIVVDDDLQLQKILSIKDQLPDLRAIVQYRGNSATPGVISWHQLLQLGKAESEEGLNQRLRKMAVNQCALLVYTSGTTGNPKGAMISHDNAVFSCVQSTKLMGWRFGMERVVSYLPLSHVAGTMLDIYWTMGVGGTTYFADADALKGTLVQNLKEFKPTRFLGMPRVWEKIGEKIQEAGKANTGVKKYVGDWAKNAALEHHLARDAGATGSTIKYRIAKKLVLSKVHEALGLDEVADLEVATGGAATPAQLQKYFLSLDIRLLDVYGSTETCGCSQSCGRPGPANCRIGTVGKQPPGLMDTRILDPSPEDGTGEIVSRGRAIFMGYLNDREKTLQAIDDDGWLRSGDLATQDQDGFFTIVGRIKEIIITAGGENVAPVNIEDEIKRSVPDLISNVMVVGDGKKFLSCLITLKVTVDPVTMQPTQHLEDSAKLFLSERGIDGLETVADVINSEKFSEISDSISEGIATANKKAISNAAKVQKFRILPAEFSVSGGELSPSLKLKRFQVAKQYQELIESMYI